MADIKGLVEALTKAVGNNKQASDALLLLTADLTMSKARISELETDLADALGNDTAQMDKFLSGIDTVVAGLDASNAKLQASTQGLGSALKSVSTARSHMETVLEDYANLDAQTTGLVDRVTGSASGILQGVLGSSVTMPPLSDLATKFLY